MIFLSTETAEKRKCISDYLQVSYSVLHTSIFFIPYYLLWNFCSGRRCSKITSLTGSALHRHAWTCFFRSAHLISDTSSSSADKDPRQEQSKHALYFSDFLRIQLSADQEFPQSDRCVMFLYGRATEEFFFSCLLNLGSK